MSSTSTVGIVVRRKHPLKGKLCAQCSETEITTLGQLIYFELVALNSVSPSHWLKIECQRCMWQIESYVSLWVWTFCLFHIDLSKQVNPCESHCCKAWVEMENGT